MDKLLNWIIKFAGLIITAPVTFLVAGDVFTDIHGIYHWIGRIAAVLLVEGVFLSAWLLLEVDKNADPAYKVQRAATAVGLYIGLWVLATIHGEGAAGIVFRAALGAALFRSIWDAGVYDILRKNRRADRDITKTLRVKRTVRKLAREDAILQARLDSERQTSKSLTTTRGGGFSGILSLRESVC